MSIYHRTLPTPPPKMKKQQVKYTYIVTFEDRITVMFETHGGRYFIDDEDTGIQEIDIEAAIKLLG